MNYCDGQDGCIPPRYWSHIYIASRSLSVSVSAPYEDVTDDKDASRADIDLSHRFHIRSR